MEESNESPSQLNRFQVDEMHNVNIVEWNKKRKLQSDQLDLLRPKHKCWIGSLSVKHASMFEENPVLESLHNFMVKSTTTDAAYLDDRSEPESAKDSNSFIEDSDTSMSEETFVDIKYNPSYDDPDIQEAMKSPEELLLELGSFSDHVFPEYVKDSNEHSIDKDFEDFLFSNGVNPNMYFLSSGRWNVNQEAQSSTRAPTIDQEFEQYFSMLML